jgi:hypothetical protein
VQLKARFYARLVLCLFAEATPVYGNGGYVDRGYGGYQPPRNTFGKLVVRNKNNNENENDEVAENDNGLDSANANAQRQIKSRKNERYDINRRYGYDSDGDNYKGGYKSGYNSGDSYESSGNEYESDDSDRYNRKDGY